MKRNKRMYGNSKENTQVSEDELNVWIANEMARPAKVKAALRKKNEFYMRVCNLSDAILKWLRAPQDIKSSIKPLSMKELQTMDRKAREEPTKKQKIILRKQLVRMEQARKEAEKRRLESERLKKMTLRDKRKEIAARQLEQQKLVQARLEKAKLRQRERARRNANQAVKITHRKRTELEEHIRNAEMKEEEQWQTTVKMVNYRDKHGKKQVQLSRKKKFMENNNCIPPMMVPNNTGYQYNMLPPPSSPPPYDIGQAFPMLAPTSMGMTPLPPPPPPPPLPADGSIPNLKPSPFASTKKSVPKDRQWEARRSSDGQSQFYASLLHTVQGFDATEARPTMAPAVYEGQSSIDAENKSSYYKDLATLINPTTATPILSKGNFHDEERLFSNELMEEFLPSDDDDYDYDDDDDDDDEELSIRLSTGTTTTEEDIVDQAGHLSSSVSPPPMPRRPSPILKVNHTEDLRLSAMPPPATKRQNAMPQAVSATTHPVTTFSPTVSKGPSPAPLGKHRHAAPTVNVSPPVVKIQSPILDVHGTKPRPTNGLSPALASNQSPMLDISPLNMQDTTFEQPGNDPSESKDIAEPPVHVVPPPPPNPFLLDDIGELQATRTSKRSMESMGSHHSGLFHDYVYNPRVEMKESGVQEKTFSTGDTKESPAVVIDPMAQTDGRSSPSNAFQNGYVYYENGIPVLMQEERIPEAKEIKRPARPHSTNTVRPPVLDGYVLYEDGIPVMVFADPSTSDEDEEA